MQAHYPASFDREMGCTEAEWLMWLPSVAGAGPLQLGPGQATVTIDEGRLLLTWQVLSPRVIALVRMPRLAVQFRFENLGDARRHSFMRRFDLHMQRGGG